MSTLRIDCAIANYDDTSGRPTTSQGGFFNSCVVINHHGLAQLTAGDFLIRTRGKYGFDYFQQRRHIGCTTQRALWLGGTAFLVTYAQLHVCRHFGMGDLDMRKLFTVCALALMITAPSLAKDIDTASTKDSAGQRVKATPVYRTKTLIGMKVKNSLGEDVGKVSELVLDAEKGTIRYAALSVGGFLGVGDKMFAVPWQSLVVNHGEKETFFLLDVDKEKLENAPGFNEANWPDVANPKFGEEIDKYYGVSAKKSAETRTSAKTAKKAEAEKSKQEAKKDAEAKQKEAEAKKKEAEAKQDQQQK
jgi:sporulation protein YlmC with PRC-barrel domain